MIAHRARTIDTYRQRFHGTSWVWPKTAELGQLDGGQIWINAMRAAKRSARDFDDFHRRWPRLAARNTDVAEKPRGQPRRESVRLLQRGEGQWRRAVLYLRSRCALVGRQGHWRLRRRQWCWRGGPQGGEMVDVPRRAGSSFTRSGEESGGGDLRAAIERVVANPRGQCGSGPRDAVATNRRCAARPFLFKKERTS